MGRISILTPCCRIISGDVWQGQTKGFNGEDLVWKSGPNAGQPRQEYYIGLAVPKDQAGNFFADYEGGDNFANQASIHAILAYAAAVGFPTAQFTEQLTCTGLPKFAWKIIDGDLPDSNDKPRPEYFAGHWVLQCKSSYPPKCYETGAVAQIGSESGKPKRGDYVRAVIEVEGNGDMRGNPGLYMHHRMLEFLGVGEAIAGGPDATKAFGGSAPAVVLPPGVSAAPPTPQTPPPASAQQPQLGVTPPGAPTPPQPGFTPPGAPQQQAAAPTQPGAPGVAPGGQPAAPLPPQPGAGVAPPPSQPVWTPVPTQKLIATGATYEQMKAQGWTDKLLFDEGYIEDCPPF